MALYFYFNKTTGDLVYSDKATYDVEGYTSLGEQTNVNPTGPGTWIFTSKRASIKTVTKDSSLSERINVLTSMSSMFRYCNALTSLDLSGFDTSSVTDMSSMFDGCTALTSLDLSGFDTSSVTSMRFMFGSCNALTSLDLSGFDTSSVTNMTSMFSNCESMRIIDVSPNMSATLNHLPAATYYDAVTRQPYAKADIPGGGTYVRDLADLDLMATMVQTRMGINRVKHALRPSMSGIGKVLWNGRITEKATLTIPDANRYGIMAVSYSGHVPVGLAMHFISITGLHMICGIAGSADTSGLSLRGFQLISDDGVSWTAQDLEILSLWGTGTTVNGQWINEADSNTLTIWGIVPSPVTQRVA